MTPDKLIPEYLKKKHEQVEAEESRRQVTSAQQRADELLISNQWSKFWKQLTEKLHLAVDSFPDLPYLKLDGKLTPFVKNQVRVEMHSTGGLRLNGTHTDLFCDGHSIHCTTLGDGVYTLKFCILSDTEIGVESSRSRGTGMDAEQAAQYVIDRMMALLERQSH
jgi:hypothetical protein